MSFEYLQGGPPEPVRAAPRARVLPWVLAGVVLLVGALAIGAVVADWVARNLEMRALVSAVESSEQAMTDTQTSVRAAFAPYRDREELSEDEQQTLRDELSAAAAAGATGVAEAGEQVAAVRILPWHTSIGDARRAYLAHNRAWRDYLTAASDDPGELLAPQDAISTTWEAAEPVMRAAVPWPVLFDLAARVDTVFREGSQDESGGDDGGDSGGDGPTVDV